MNATKAIFEISNRSTRVDFFEHGNYISTLTGLGVEYCLTYCKTKWKQTDYGVYIKTTGENE